MLGVFPGAEYRPVRFTGRTGILDSPLGWILHVAEMDGSPWRLFDESPVGSRKVSTGWVAKDGRVEQYIPATDRPWAQQSGNAQYHAWETEGFAVEPLTSAQIESLGAIHVWHRTADRVVSAPGGLGIGTHQMGGLSWGNHACPGALRAAQRERIIEAAKRLREQGATVTELSESTMRRLADVIQTRYQVRAPHGELVTDDAALAAMWGLLIKVSDQLDRLEK
jgi:hypothetical protein